MYTNISIGNSKACKSIQTYKDMHISNWNVTSAGWYVTLCDPIMAREF